MGFIRGGEIAPTKQLQCNSEEVIHTQKSLKKQCLIFF